jgi:hypothetical protein
MEWTALENQVLQNRCKLLEMCFQDSLKKPCRMLTCSFAVLSPRFLRYIAEEGEAKRLILGLVRLYLRIIRSSAIELQEGICSQIVSTDRLYLINTSSSTYVQQQNLERNKC